MEASAAAGPAAAAGDGAGEQQQGQQQQGQEQQQQPDLAALYGTLQELGPSLEDLRGQLTEQQQMMLELQAQQTQDPAQQQQLEQQAQQPNLDAFNPDAPGWDPQRAAQGLAELMQQQTQQAVQQAVTPLQEQLAGIEAQRQADLLANEFPELQDPQVAENVINVSRQYAELLGKPELADNPAFWRLAYMSGRAAEAANAEGQPQPAAATLEGGSGASPGGADQRQQVVDGILNANGAGRSVLPF